MSNIYKLQRYVNDSWVDVQLGQMNAGSGDGSTSLEQYLTLSEIENQFVSASLIRGDITKQTLEQGIAGALGRYSSSFGNSMTLGKGSIAFGGDVSGDLAQSQVTGYWNVSDEIFYMEIDELDDTVSSNISELEKQIIRATAENENYFLVITKVEGYQTNYYRFTFSTAEGDWENFKLRLGGLVDHNSTSSLVNAQFTFINHIARGDNSFVSGKSNIASSTYSHALGWNLNATRTSQTVVGEWNTTNNDALFIVGGGSYAGRKNILEVGPDLFKFTSTSEEYTLKNADATAVLWTELTTPLSSKFRNAKQFYVVINFYYYIGGGPNTGYYSTTSQAFVTKVSHSGNSGYDLTIIPFTIYNNFIPNYIMPDDFDPGLQLKRFYVPAVYQCQIVFDYKNNCSYVMSYSNERSRWELGCPTGTMKLFIYYLN